MPAADRCAGLCTQAFARLSAVYGGTYMLSKPDVAVAYENGVAVAVTAEGETAKAKLIVGDPSYFPDKVQRASRVRMQPQALRLVILSFCLARGWTSAPFKTLPLATQPNDFMLDRHPLWGPCCALCLLKAWHER